MDHAFAFILLLLSSSTAFTKYVYVTELLTWHNAQMYCRTFYTDLAPVSNQQEADLLQQTAADVNAYLWIGLKRSSADRTKWLWSGGGEVSSFFWAPFQPNDRQGEDYGLIHEYGWHDATPDYNRPFLCYSSIVVRERKTWVEALEHCREHHYHLATMASETEMLLIRSELEKYATTEHVWIGLHYFSDRWMWVNGQPMDYEAWDQESKPTCPAATHHCAALQVMGQVQITSTADPTAATDVNQGVWKANDCEERLYFICY